MDNENKGKGWNWVKENGGTVIDTANDLLCLINPKRYGCYPPPGQQIQQVATSDNIAIYIGMGLIIMMLFVLALRK